MTFCHPERGINLLEKSLIWNMVFSYVENEFLKFVSQRLFCLKNGNLEFNLKWDSLKKKTL